MSDDLLQQLKTGGEQAYKSLFYLYYADLVRYASSIVGDREVAQDIVQEFFINFWYERKYEKVKTGLGYYVFRSIRNNCLSYIRNEKRQKNRLVHLTENEREECHFTLEEMEEREELYGAVNRLPEQCRVIFNLCCVEEMKYQEVADRLGISINTVRTQMARAFKFLRDVLNGKTFSTLLFFIIIEYCKSMRYKKK